MKGIEVKNCNENIPGHYRIVSGKPESGSRKNIWSSRTERRREIHSFKSDNQPEIPG